MKNLYFPSWIIVFLCFFLPGLLTAQDCSLLSATAVTYESRCAATGSVKVFAIGGSGSYKYKTAGPVNTNFTTTDSITGLSAGTYSVIVTDIVTNCTFTLNDVVVDGTYQDPRFTIDKVDVTCDHGNNGGITVNSRQFGRAPFMYSIVAPSPYAVGTTSGTGTFNNLIAGDYSIRLTDSCGGIQTRLITIDDYSWWIDSYLFLKLSCDSASGYIKVVDSKGNVSTATGIPGFSYGIVRQPGDTIWSLLPNFGFNTAGFSTFHIVAKDACGNIKQAAGTLSFATAVAANVNTYGYTCNTFSVSLVGVSNFYDPGFCLFDSADVQVACNLTGQFIDLPYGSYCIRAHDSCTDTTIIRCFSRSAPSISVSNTVNIHHKTCTSFSVTVVGQSGLTNPLYCLFDSTHTLTDCNSNGSFHNLAYGNYCITIKDGCIDTTIDRCFTAVRPTPSLPATIDVAYTTCSVFGIVVGGDSLTDPVYCLYDSNGVRVTCNNTGIFDSIPLGNYCVQVYDSCFDTTITRCLSILTPFVTDDTWIDFTNKTCSTFTATANSSNLIAPGYCLYSADSVLIICDSTGIFPGLAYGSYCLRSHTNCPDTGFTQCFTVAAPVPSVNGHVNISNKTCSTFTARVSGIQNLTAPQFCIFDTANVQVSCNATGVFDNLPYGDYCIRIINSCYDTTIERCFTASPNPVGISVNAKKSCSYGFAKFSILVYSGSMPVTVKIYGPDSNLFFSGTYNNSNINIDNIPPTVSGDTYKIVVTDDCGSVDSVITNAVASTLTHAPRVIGKCPSASWANGSGNIEVTASSNMGQLTVRIIKMNGAVLSPYISPNSVVAAVFTFEDLAPATYIIRYKANDGCNNYLYDTVAISPYQYPDLNRSSAYQCDINGFSVGAVASGGLAPFTYEIIGSTPTSPSIIAGPQTNPVFNIDNGTNYSLVRLRALDACGNASLQDASILPLANNGIVASFNCFQLASTLSVDTIYNSTYAWYKKDNWSDTDSTYLGSGFSTYLPFVLPPDTGTYICHVVVNSGCIERTYYYNLNGDCFGILPLAMKEFTADLMDDKVLLKWSVPGEGLLKYYVVERRNRDESFTEIGRVIASGFQSYSFLDNYPETGKNFYRLKLVNANNSYTNSDIVEVSRKQKAPVFKIYPNPVSDMLTVELPVPSHKTYKIFLLNSVSQVVREVVLNGADSNKVQISRTGNMGAGLYIVRIIDVETNEQLSKIVLFR